MPDAVAPWSLVPSAIRNFLGPLLLWLTVCWVVVFFFASAGASSAYLTVSEIFPMETRALAIVFFYAVGTRLSGIVGPILFGLVEVFLGINADNRSLEDIAEPLSSEPLSSEPLSSKA